MNLEIKKKWIDALKSGEFKQGRHRLRQKESEGSSYCCLGVLCELASREGVINPVNQQADGEYFYDNSRTYLPPKVCHWAQITSIEDTHKVADINDRVNSFEEVIPFIEDNF